MNIVPAPLDTLYEQDRGRIEINTEFTEGLASCFEKRLTVLFDYYKYRQVSLVLNSPGGSLTALQYILSVIGQARQNGYQVHTQGSFTAASAGALLLSHGEVGTRSVMTVTKLLYHHTRVNGATAGLTSSDAHRLSSAMKSHDDKLIAGLVAHLVKGFGSVEALCAQGAARCDLLASNQVTLAKELDLNVSSSFKWVNAVAKVYRDCLQRNSTVPLQKYLEKRFAPDTAMDLHEGYALLLIDTVANVTTLLPDAQPAMAPVTQVHNQLKLAA